MVRGGGKNNISGVLSCNDNSNVETLTNVICATVPSQLPEHSTIVSLPKEISSWLTSLFLKLHVKAQLQKTYKVQAWTWHSWEV